jgi:hypothetical protein
MNKYAMTAESYKVLMERGKIDKTIAEKTIRIYDFLAACDSDDICQLVDSSAFNDIIRAYLQLAIANSSLDEESRDRVTDQLYWLLDTKQAKEVLRSVNA